MSDSQRITELADRAVEDGYYGFQDLCLLIAEALGELTQIPTPELDALLANLPSLYQAYSSGDSSCIDAVITILQHPDLQIMLADDELMMLVEQLRADIITLGAQDESATIDIPNTDEPVQTPALSKVTLELVALLHTEAVLIDGLLNAMAIDQTESIASGLEQLCDNLERYINASRMAGFEALALVCEQIYANSQLFLSDVSGYTADRHALLQSVIAEIMVYLANFSDSDAGLPLLRLLSSPDWHLPVSLEDASLIMAQFKAVNVNLDEQEITHRKQIATAEDIALTLPDDVNPELLEILLHELPVQIQEFSAAILRLQAGGSLADLEIAQRVAHTLKGAANTVGIKGIAELTHPIEDILLSFSAQQQTPDSGLLAVLMNAADCLAVMGESLTGLSLPPEDALAVLQQVLDWANQIDQMGITARVDALPRVASKHADFVAGDSTLTPTPANRVRIDSQQLDELFTLADGNVILNSQANERLRRLRKQLQTMGNQVERLRQLGDELEQLIDLKDLSGLALTTERVDFDALEMDQYNELHTASRRMVEAAFDAREITKDAEKELDAMGVLLEDQQRLANETQAVIMQTRLLPVSSIAQRLQRGLRQTCRLTQKHCDLQLFGEQLLVNGDTLNTLIEPLMHLLRNAVDHGIESTENRLAAGKAERGKITLHFAYEGNNIRVHMQDDGQGLDFAAIRETAIRRGLCTKEQVFTEKELSRFILRSSFSTRSHVTQTSGRGVGMDAVYFQVLAAGGTLSLESETGRGLSVELKVPLPMSRVHALLTQTGTFKVALSNKGITQILFAGSATISEIDNQLFVQLGDTRYMAVTLNKLLNISDRRHREAKPRTALLVQYDEQVIAVLLDVITDSLDIVIKNPGIYLTKIPGFVGAAIIGDGSVAPVVDLPDLLRSQHTTDSALAADEFEAHEALAVRLPTVLLVDDSLSQRRALEQLLQDAGFQVRIARDGIEATEQLAEFKPDIVLTDLEMPRMNGIELTAHIRTRDHLKTLPVIMITSRTTQAHRQLALDAGIDFYLVKPVQEDDLLSKMQSLMTL